MSGEPTSAVPDELSIPFNWWRWENLAVVWNPVGKQNFQRNTIVSPFCPTRLFGDLLSVFISLRWRIMVSIFMSLVNVHANWYPVDGTVKKVWHKNGKFMKAWLPKASTDNERSTVVIETPEGVEIMARQIAGAMARRIVTYAEPGEECYIDEHMGFIKFGSRVDVFLPLGTEVFVKLGQLTTGNQTVIAKLK